ncbi:hypothetical protein, partial [Mesorhizobium sanjuanii]|uniref:hypothetical protein n=1 Tax=Mesorhizobium sanjuanii TaxID=2037900 RepID=UPI001AD84A72
VIAVGGSLSRGQGFGSGRFRLSRDRAEAGWRKHPPWQPDFDRSPRTGRLLASVGRLNRDNLATILVANCIFTISG